MCSRCQAECSLHPAPCSGSLTWGLSALAEDERRVEPLPGVRVEACDELRENARLAAEVDALRGRCAELQRELCVCVEKLAGFERERDELAEARRAAGRAVRQGSVLLGQLSHDLRTPVNGIIGFSELLEQELYGPLLPKQREYVEQVRVSGYQLLDLVGDVVDLARIGSGAAPLYREWIPLSVFLASAEDALASLFERRGVTLEVDGRDEHEAVYIDLTRLLQAFVRLMPRVLDGVPRGGAVRLRGAIEGDTLALSIGVIAPAAARAAISGAHRQLSGLLDPDAAPASRATLALSLAAKILGLHDATVELAGDAAGGVELVTSVPLIRRSVADRLELAMLESLGD